MDRDKKYEVFLSYSQRNLAWATEFACALREAGVDALWFDAHELSPGEVWQDRIQQALRQSRTLVVVLGPDGIDSPWTYFELGAAVGDGKRIIPVLTEDCNPKQIPLPLTRFRWLQASSATEAGKRVAQVVGKKKPRKARCAAAVGNKKSR